MEGIIFEEGLGHFIPIEKVSDAGLVNAIQQLLDEVVKRKARRGLIDLLEQGKPFGKELARKLREG